MKSLFSILIILITGAAFYCTAGATSQTVSGKISFIQPKDGAKLKSPFKVLMKAEGIKVRAAGEAVDEKASGHHHLLINQGPIPLGQPIPADDQHIHYGKGQTEAEISLAPGAYTLTLQFADGAHRSYGPKLSQSIKIEVLPAENSGKK